MPSSLGSYGLETLSDDPGMGVAAADSTTPTTSRGPVVLPEENAPGVGDRDIWEMEYVPLPDSRRDGHEQSRTVRAEDVLNENDLQMRNHEDDEMYARRISRLMKSRVFW